MDDWRKMNWDDLKIFLYVARRKTLSKAATDLKLDETTVSRRLKRLEENLGQTLFERLRTGHVLTAHGVSLRIKAEAIERQTDEVLKAKGTSVRKPSGTIRVSVSEGFGAFILAPALHEFASDFPDVEIELVSGSGFLSLSKREADIAIGLSRPNSKYISSEPLSEYKLHLYASSKYLKNRDDIKTISDLKDHKLIGYMDDLAYSDRLRYFHEKLPHLRPVVRSTSIVAQRNLVESGVGIAILPDFLVDNGFTCLLRNEVSVTRKFWFLAHQSVVATDRVRAFKSFAIERLRDKLQG